MHEKMESASVPLVEQKNLSAQPSFFRILLFLGFVCLLVWGIFVCFNLEH